MNYYSQYLCFIFSAGKTGGIVRLIHRQFAERALIKGYNGSVVDLAFAYAEADILATMDESGSLFVHKIELDQSQHVTYPLRKRSMFQVV